MKTKKKIILIVIVIIIVAGAGLAIDQFIVLQKAHSTFDNYYVFRGCTQLHFKDHHLGCL